jgi:hypothetical protein
MFIIVRKIPVESFDGADVFEYEPLAIDFVHGAKPFSLADAKGQRTNPTRCGILSTPTL